MDAWNFIGDDTEDESFTDEKFGRDCILCAVDCSEPMFLVKSEDGLTHFELSMKVVLNLYNAKCVANERDYIGIVLYNTEKSKNTHNFENIFLLHEPGIPNADKVKEIIKLLEGDTRERFKSDFGHKDCKMDEMFWTCATIFSNTDLKEGTKKIFLFTNCDFPHRTDIDRQKRVLQKIQDLREQRTVIEVFPVGRDFGWENFYISALFDDDKSAVPCAADKLDELMERAVRKQFKKRAMATVTFTLAPDLELSCSLFNIIAPARIPQPVKLAKETNEEIKTVKTFLNVETGEKLLPIDMKKYQTYGGTKISMDNDEVEQLRKLCPPGLVLIGFQRKTSIKPYFYVRQGLFVYPEESKIKGSTAIFRCLLERCVAKEVVAVCRLTARTNMAPRLVALVPQIEELDVKGFQEQAAGFHVVFLPYADDVRDLSKKLTSENFSKPDVVHVQKAKDFVDKLVIDYNPDTVTNPVLQTHYKAIEAYALDREDVEEVADHTKPNIDWMVRKAGHAMQEFSKAVYPADYVAGPLKSKKKISSEHSGKNLPEKRAKIDLEEEAKAGRLNKLTVPMLKDMCLAMGVKLTATRKADIIQQINQHFDVIL